MSFDSSKYWNRRKDNLQGQDYPVPQVVSKTEKVYVVDKNTGKKKEFLSDPGSHLIRSPGEGTLYVNRKTSRRKDRSHPATKKNYIHQLKEYGFKHTVNKKEFKPSHPPGLSNHVRHRQRQVERELKRKELQGSKV